MSATPNGRSDEDTWRTADGATALGALFDRHADRVHGHCLRQLGSVADAEDATAATFLTAWRRRADLRFVDGSALPWLLVTATNTCRNLARARRRHRAWLDRLPRPDVEPDPAEAAALRLDAAGSGVVRAFRSLGTDAQVVLTLCDIEGLGYEQAARVLGVPVGTVRSRLSRAREWLRHALAATTPPLSEEVRP
ncbi:RNA polymerase sigma factor [Jatrophihabitans sp. YIM 134969]